jgi:amidohydrolase
VPPDTCPDPAAAPVDPPGDVDPRPLRGGGGRAAASAQRVKLTPVHRRQLILRAAERLNDRLVGIRRDLHTHPEVGNAEHRTTQVIIDTLTAAGLSPRVLPVGTGALCDVLPNGSAEEPVVGLRADIDALPIHEGNDLPYRSVHPGVCHACGHDVHTAIVLGVGLILAQLRERGMLDHGVRLIFQPAEETSPGGALDAIDGGALDGLSEVYALHCDPRTEVGRIALRTGAVTSAVDSVLIKLTSSGGHTSRPHLTGDLVGALGALATTMPLLLTRRVDPRSGVSLVWGRIQAGGVANAIPASGEIEGTLRALSVQGWRDAQQIISSLATQVVAPYGVGIHVSVTAGVPPAVNHAAGVERFAAAAKAILGRGSVASTDQSLGGEDFSWMLQQVPGALARLGVRTSGARSAPDIHQSTFNVDEACIGVGVKVLTELATSGSAPSA